MEIFYHSFSLRIWKNNTRNIKDWYASLEDRSIHKIIALNQPGELFACLLLISKHLR